MFLDVNVLLGVSLGLAALTIALCNNTLNAATDKLVITSAKERLLVTDMEGISLWLYNLRGCVAIASTILGSVIFATWANVSPAYYSLTSTQPIGVCFAHSLPLQIIGHTLQSAVAVISYVAFLFFAGATANYLLSGMSMSTMEHDDYRLAMYGAFAASMIYSVSIILAFTLSRLGLCALW